MTSPSCGRGNFAIHKEHHTVSVRVTIYDDIEDDGMDIITAPQLSSDATSNYGSDIDLPSDYGSDVDPEEELLANVLTGIAETAPKTVPYPSIEVDDEDSELAVVTHKSLSARSGPTTNSPVDSRGKRCASVEVEYDRQSRNSWSVPRGQRAASVAPESSLSTAPQTDTRSPLERFRTKPQKPLSVTDLVSPAWCQLQYWYTLTKFGRKPQTQAMKQGSKVHRVLEEQVHTIVPVQTKTKEDRFGLRIWNSIQGLRTLRETGLTRELQIWGIIDGQVVNGIIDEISYTCPDPVLEESLEKSNAEKSGGTLPPSQLKIEQSFLGNSKIWRDSLKPKRQIYIADVKTRGHKSVPNGASLRPTYMQLMLYRKLLESLSLNTVDAETIFARYNLKSLEPFSEVFMLEINGLDGGGDDMVTDDENPFAILQASEIEQHNNLLALWSLMISEFSQTIHTFSDILRAEFRWSKTGEMIGNTMTTYDEAAIDEYIAMQMHWWKGEREAQGVEIEEAFKCRICDFAEECSWRKDKVEEAVEKHRLRAEVMGKSAV